MDRVDREVTELIREAATEVGEPVVPGDAVVPSGDAINMQADVMAQNRDPLAERPSSTNPPASDLRFTAREQQEADEVIARLQGYLQGYSTIPADARTFDLDAALAQAIRTSREYKFEEEEYVLASLRLLIERHLWGPRFFNDVSADITAIGDGGTYDTSLRLVNEFRITQRLPYGGEVSARALATAVEDLHHKVQGQGVQDATIILDAGLPLLRGAGNIAREGLIQAERDVIYAARDFARFRREFLFDIASDYLDIIVLAKQVENSRRGVGSFRELEREMDALLLAGRNPPVDAAEAKNNTLEAVDDLNRDQELYRLALDQFKVRLGLPIDEPIIILPDGLGLPTPDAEMDEAIRAAMAFRLDLQNVRDEVGDAIRGVDNAENLLLPTLDLRAGVVLPTDDDLDRAGLQFDSEDMTFTGGVTFGLPLDREIERLTLRARQVALARSTRAYDQFRDQIAVNVRAAVRGIDATMFSLEIQETNVVIAKRREAAIQADPASADVTQKSDAITATARARNNRDRSARNLQVAILGYLLATGRLRVDGDGYIEMLPGMAAAPPAVDAPALPPGDIFDQP